VSSDIIEAPLESVREVEEEEEDNNDKGAGAGAGEQSAPSTPMVPPRPTEDGVDVENQPPTNTPNVPALKLPEISDPEVTGGKDDDDGPASARLGVSDETLQGEAKKLVDGQVLSSRLESGEDPLAVLPELIKQTDKPEEPNTSAAAGLAAEVQKEESS
jgi:hypothetical protein